MQVISEVDKINLSTKIKSNLSLEGYEERIKILQNICDETNKKNTDFENNIN
jgi:hypothetical protein